MARSNRVKADGEAFYHVVSRIANKAFLIRDTARKRRLLDMLRRAAEFSGVCLLRIFTCRKRIEARQAFA